MTSMLSSAPQTSRKRSRYAIAESAIEHSFVAVDAVITLLNKRGISPTLQLVSRVASSALSASSGGGGGIVFDDQRLVELVSLAQGIFSLGTEVVGGGGSLHVSIIPSVQGSRKRDISARLRAFRVAIAARAREDCDDGVDKGIEVDTTGGDDALTVASTVGTCFSEGDVDGTMFPTALADEWVKRAVAEMGLENIPVSSPLPPPQRLATASLDTPLLTISTRGLASRAGGRWPLVQRRIDNGLQTEMPGTFP